MRRTRYGLSPIFYGTLFALCAFLVLSCGQSPQSTQTPKAATEPAAIQHAVIPVKGMTCTGCENSLRLTLAAVPGIQGATPDHQAANAEIAFDANQIQLQQIVAAIDDKTDFEAAAPETKTEN